MLDRWHWPEKNEIVSGTQLIKLDRFQILTPWTLKPLVPLFFLKHLLSVKLISQFKRQSHFNYILACLLQNLPGSREMTLFIVNMLKPKSYGHSHSPKPGSPSLSKLCLGNTLVVMFHSFKCIFRKAFHCNLFLGLVCWLLPSHWEKIKSQKVAGRIECKALLTPSPLPRPANSSKPGQPSRSQDSP